MNFLIFLNPVPLQKREYNNIGLRNMKKWLPVIEYSQKYGLLLINREILIKECRL